MTATATTGTVGRPHHNHMLDPTDVMAINATIGDAMSTVPINGSYINVIVPEGLRRALFVDWEEHPNVLLLLFGFARDMEIPIYMLNPNGTRYIIQPPPPPKRGKVGNGYEYKKFGRFSLKHFGEKRFQVMAEPIELPNVIFCIFREM